MAITVAMEKRPEARILVVDDEDQIRRLVTLLLRRLKGCEAVVQQAADANEALALLEYEEFDLIVSDHNMPGKTGIDLLEHAQKQHPQTARMLITALTQLDIGVDAINRGRVDAFLRKPFDNEVFLTLAESLVTPRVTARRLLAEGHADDGVASGSRTIRRIPAPPPPHDSTRHGLESELAEVEKAMRQLRVRLGLGNISPEGYAQVNSDLSKRRADLEVKLLQLEA
ncbi:MAG: response regulator [Candidatus Thermoplasmatota archaeon]